MKTVLIKCGGSVLDELTSSFFSSLKDLEKQGYRLLFVHGGGPDINKMLDLYNIEHEFVNGLRKTTAEAMEIVEMVLSGKTNRKLAAMLNANGFKAFGLNGSDAKVLQAEFIDEEKLGFVGDIKKVNIEAISMLLNDNYTPVITPIASGENGMRLNVNADYAAVAIAKALNADHFLFVTDVDGIVIDGQVVQQIDTDEIDKYIIDKQITGGMIPKVKSAIGAIESGLQSVRIVSGKNPFFEGDQWNGTVIKAGEKVYK